MIIRRFKESDTPHIARLFHETVRSVNRDDYTWEQIRAWAPDEIFSIDWTRRCNDRHTYIADTREGLLGFAALESKGHIDLFYCHKDHQRSGVGSHLYRAIELKARELGITRLTTDSSITAKPFFEAKGFTVIEEREKEIREIPLPYFFMEKSLKTRIRLKMIGFWYTYQNSEFIEPQLLSGWWDPDIKNRVTGYLENAAVVDEQNRYSWCRFSCGTPDRKMGYRLLSDGKWIWPEDLIHYVSEHDVRLPEKFVSHMEANRWHPPALEQDVYDVQMDREEWIAFCREQRNR